MKAGMRPHQRNAQGFSVSTLVPPHQFRLAHLSFHPPLPSRNRAAEGSHITRIVPARTENTRRTTPEVIEEDGMRGVFLAFNASPPTAPLATVATCNGMGSASPTETKGSHVRTSRSCRRKGLTCCQTAGR